LAQAGTERTVPYSVEPLIWQGEKNMHNDDAEMFGTETPWEMLLHTIDASQQHKEVIEELIKSHNSNMRRLHRLEADIQNLNRRLTNYEIGSMAKNSSQ